MAQKKEQQHVVVILTFLVEYILKKSLGQHFLHDEAVCQNIVAQLPHIPNGKVLEIGPGAGALTKYLAARDHTDYMAIEIDHEKVLYLLKQMPQLSANIIEGDILKVAAPFDGPFDIIGNLPYNISSPIMFRLLEWRQQVHTVVAMFQKEVAKRIASGPGTKQYGILSVLMQAFFSVEYLFDVSEQCFTPPPKVMSGVLKFSNCYDPYNIGNIKRFIQLVKAAFGQRRKTLRNALRGTLPPHLLVQPIFDKRAEQLSVQDFVALYRMQDGA